MDENLPILHIGKKQPDKKGTTLPRLQIGHATGSNARTLLGTDTRTQEQISVDDVKRQSGMYVLGVQGTGKSSFLESLIYQDICKGYSVIVIDPHGDLIDHVISQMPESRVKDTYLLDIEETDYPFGVNLFSVPVNTGQLLKTIAVERMMHVFERVFPASARMLLDKYLENIALVFLENHGYTMADIPRFLRDEELRKTLTTKLKNTYVRDFWEEYNKLAPGKRREETAALINRLNSFLNKPMVRNIVGQKTSTIDFRKAIQRHEILLIRLPVKELKNIASLIGTMLVAQIHQATFSFANTPASQRPGYSLYVDEFQNFSTLDFAELFTEARKYKARQTVAHQYTKQLTLEELREATTTAYTVIAFRTTAHDSHLFSSTFSDLNLNTRPDEIPKDIFKRMKYADNPPVRAFYDNYVARMQKREDEPLELGHRFNQSLTFKDALETLEMLLYDAMRKGKWDDDITYHMRSFLHRVSDWQRYKGYFHVAFLGEDITAVAKSAASSSWSTYRANEFTQEMLEEEKANFERFYKRLSECVHALMDEPFGEIKDTDVTSLLQHLPNFTALARVGDKTFYIKPNPIPDYIRGSELRHRKQAIKLQTQHTYCRKRGDIEKELQKQTQWVQEDSDEEALKELDEPEDEAEPIQKPPPEKKADNKKHGWSPFEELP